LIRPVTALLFLLLFAGTATAQIIPSSRLTVWEPGIPGGIPNRTTICATLNAATYGNGSTDATSAIQNAINNCPAGQVVKLGTGTFRINGFLEIGSNKTLRGDGPENTILDKPTGTGQPVAIIGNRYSGPYDAYTNLTANAVKGEYSVTVTSTTGLSVGAVVLIDQLQESGVAYYSNDCDSSCQGWFARSGRPMGEVKEIAAIDGSTVTFTTPFHWTYKTSLTAQLGRNTGGDLTKYAGVEDLKVVDGEGGDDGGGFKIEYCAYCWLKNVETVGTLGSAFHMYASFRSVVRDSYFHETRQPSPGGNGYGMDISSYTSDSLFENNISWYFNKVMVMRAAGGGNVIGYNYVEDGLIDYDEGWIESGLNATHMATAHFVLFEGNQGFNIDADIRWGNSVYITFLRNHVTAARRDINDVGLTLPVFQMVGVGAWHYWYNFAGNVLGYSGMPSNTPVWDLGQRGPFTTPTTGTDTQVEATILREGNWTYTDNSISWSDGAQTIPDSYYLSSKPDFFGNCTWPWVDPTGSTKVHTLPARARFDGDPDACSAPAVRPNPPTDITVTAVPSRAYRRAA
jgi:hypothetical protein